MKVTDIYLLSGTHWDREWYETFQGFRNRLVKMVDDILDYMEETPEFETFHFDGQTIVLEDYTEIAPENSKRLQKLISESRIKIGPWYDMPDEFLVSGESLIRNLMRGFGLSKKWGTEPWKFGYICDIFGHIAQMPQIFNGFGIDYALLGRGTNEEDERSFFVWQSPDGSRCTTFRLRADQGYCGFCRDVIDISKSDKELKENIKRYIDSEIERSNAPVIILMDGADHTPLHHDTPKYLEYIRELYPDIRVHHCDLTEIDRQLGGLEETLPILKGELNKTAIRQNSYLHLITNTLSSYYTHKKMNDDCQNLLEKIVEPMLAFSALDGNKVRRSYVNLAYKYLLQNHPHDSICGCSIEQVHKDMVYRFDQIKEISETLISDFLFENRPKPGNSHNYILRIYNSLAFERHECVTADIVLGHDFPVEYSEPFGYESIFSFKILDAEGKEVPYEIVKCTKNYMKRVHELKKYIGECYTVSFKANIPPMGFAEFKIVPCGTPNRYLEKMTSGADFAENEYIKMSINSDGELDIFDKKTGREYKNLLSFADDSEIGDGWFHANPMHDTIVYSKGCGANIEKIENGPSKCVFRITKHIEVPEENLYLQSGICRSNKYVLLPIVIEAALSEGARFADIKLKIKNTAKDHRLRLAIPTGITEKTYFAGQAFCFNERKTGIDYSSGTWREHEQYEKQTDGIVGKRDSDGNGLAFVSASGIHECAAYDDGLIYVTLLRSFRKTVETMGEEGGQLLGDLKYAFRLAPIDGGTSYSDIVRLRDALAAAPISVSSRASDEYEPKSKSFMKLCSDDLVMSIAKPTEDGEEKTLIVRVYNPSDKTAVGSLEFADNITHAYSVNLNEENEAELEVSGNSLPVSLGAWKIGTYKIKL